ncbi:MAG: protein kinase [Anaeromyxobacteraceae bacterium]
MSYEGSVEQVSVQPGAMSALLEELFRSPAPGPGADEPALAPGTRVGRFELREVLGRGGFGVVYEALDVELGRTVAFKLVRPGRRNPAREARLLLEAEAAARLSHPNIVTLFDLGRSEHGPYLVLELLRGETVGARAARGPLPRGEALRIATEVARGLAHAHAAGVVHRDLAPGNVFVCDDGRVKILDLGMAQAFGRERVDGGTPGFMAPEQRAGGEEDARTDVWALGALLGTMLGATLAGDRRWKAPPGRLGEVLARMQAEAPADRYRDAGDVLAALAQASPEREAARRATWLATGAAALAVAAMAGGWLWLTRPARVELPGLAVAVLPFEDASPAHDQGHLADGLAAEVQEGLARRAGLRVTGFASSRRARGLSPAEAGARLGVGALVEGALRRAGDDLEVEARLVRASDGKALWSRTLTARAAGGAFELQRRVAAAIVEALGLDGEAAAAPAAGARTPAPEAYETYLRVRTVVYGDGDDWPALLAGIRRATELDPGFAEAWALRAGLEFSQIPTETIPFPERCARGLSAADRAVALAPALGEARAVRGWLRVNCGLDWEGAREDFRRALALEAGNPEVLRRAGAFALQDGARFDEAIALMRRAADLDPLTTVHWTWLGRAYWGAGRLAEARAAVERAVALSPRTWANSLLGYLDLEEGRPLDALEHFGREGVSRSALLRGRALAYHDLGRQAEAQAALDEMILQFGADTHYGQATIYAWWGDTDRALAALERGLGADAYGKVEARWDPLLRRLRADPRALALLRRAGIPE